MYQFPIGMEMFSAADEEQWEIIKETIDSSDYYVLIIGHRYGSVIKDGDYAGISYTQKEFYYALEKEIPVLAFLIDGKATVMPENMEQDSDKKEKLEQFIGEVKIGRTVQWWVNKDDLANKVMNSLNKQIKRKNRPGWVRLNGNEKTCESKIDIEEIINSLQDMETEIQVAAERGFLDGINGSCHIPIGAYCDVDGENVSLTGLYGDEEGNNLIIKTISGKASEAREIGLQLAKLISKEYEDYEW